MEQQLITKLNCLIHPFAYVRFEDIGAPFPETPPFYNHGGFLRYLEYERILKQRWFNAISNLGPQDALVLLPFESFRTQHDLERHGEQALGARCVILHTLPFQPGWISPKAEPEFRMGIADDLLAAFQSRGYEWRAQDMKVAVFSRSYAWEMQAAFRDRGLCFDPATVDSVAWGESFEGCVTKWSNGLGAHLGLQKPIEKEFRERLMALTMGEK